MTTFQIILTCATGVILVQAVYVFRLNKQLAKRLRAITQANAGTNKTVTETITDTLRHAQENGIWAAHKAWSERLKVIAPDVLLKINYEHMTIEAKKYCTPVKL